ncbi:PucR family transcriptional regulator [Enterococcus alishanensis]|uniref:Helix-turn-helix domain-containing protein n=1 Tax=Enterococcus alishanensis TaxID=1303817 RepID=A0ABS6TA24_9ENTE|nr:helix-turn-helix domain-containing protein [Enterococcus alishanensis]MBV7389747.1 helix-turn-helix domain-containing protein [Enterococcus alishanensis]
MNFTEIIATLQQFGSIRKIQDSHSQTLKHLSFVNEDTIYDQETLYFMNSPQKKTETLPPYCILGEQDIYQHFSAVKANGLAIVEAKSLQVFFNHAKRIMQAETKKIETDNWLPVINNMKDLNEIANTTATIFNNSVIFMDINHRVLAHSTVYPISDVVWSDIINKGYLSYQYILDAESPDFLLAPDSGEPVTLTCWASPLRKLCSKIVSSETNDWLGYIVMIEEESQISSFHLDWMPIISRAASKILVQDPLIISMKKSIHSKILYELIIGAKVQDLTNTLKQINFLDNNERCVAMIAAEKPIDQQVFFLKIPQLLNKILPKSYFTYHENRIIAMIELSDTIEYFDSEKLDELNRLINKYQLRIGISTNFTQISEFRRHVEQAKRAITLAKIFEDEQIATYEKYSFYDLLRRVTLSSEDNLRDFCHPAVQKLREYDYFHQTTFSLTLKTYLDQAGSLKMTAAKLFIHRNTLLYRMDRIKELLAIDLEDPNLRFHLMVSYKIEKFSQIISQEECCFEDSKNSISI